MNGLALEQISEERRAALQLLSQTGERGTAALSSGLLHGAHLAAFVYYGLAERWREVDRIGSQFRYRVTPKGASVLEKLNLKPVARGHTAVMASRDKTADERDFYPTWPWGARAGAELIRQLDPAAKSVWEPACGAGHMVHGFRDYFASVHASDAYWYDGNRIFEFINGADTDAPYVADWIATNPPFAQLEDFIRVAHRRARRGVAMLLRLGCLAGQERDRLFHDECGLSAVAPFSERLPLLKGRCDPEITSATDYAWYFFEKHRRVARPHPIVLRIPPGTRARLTRPSDAAFAIGEAA